MRCWPRFCRDRDHARKSNLGWESSEAFSSTPWRVLLRTRAKTFAGRKRVNRTFCANDGPVASAPMKKNTIFRAAIHPQLPTRSLHLRSCHFIGGMVTEDARISLSTFPGTNFGGSNRAFIADSRIPSALKLDSPHHGYTWKIKCTTREVTLETDSILCKAQNWAQWETGICHRFMIFLHKNFRLCCFHILFKISQLIA